MSALAGAIKTRLTGYAPLTALVSDRIYLPHLRQESVLPAVYYSLNSSTPQNTLQAETGLINDSWEVVAVGDSFASASQVADEIQGAMAPYGADFVAIRQAVSFTYLSDTGLYLLTSDYSIWANL